MRNSPTVYLALTLLLLSTLMVTLPSRPYDDDQRLLSPLETPMHSQTVLIPDTVAQLNWTVEVRSGPFYVSIDCSAGSECPEVTLTLADNTQTLFQASGRFRVELQGNLSYGTHLLTISRDSTTGDLGLALTTIWLDQQGGEFLDSPSDIPLPGAASDDWPVLDAEGCTDFVDCADHPRTSIGPQSSWWNGTLEDGDDADSLRLNGSTGDVFEIQLEAYSAIINLDIWERTSDDLTLLSSQTYSVAQTDESYNRRIFSQVGDGELWLALAAVGGEGGMYALKVARHQAAAESDAGELRGTPYLAPSHAVGMLASGQLASDDEAGDTLLFPAGSRTRMQFNWTSSGPAEVELLVHNLTWTSDQTWSSSVEGAEVVLPAGADGVGIRFSNQSSALIWTLMAQDLGPRDAGELGDAVDDRPTAEVQVVGMTAHTGASGTITGSLESDDPRDVYLIERELGFPDRSWFSATLDSEPGCCEVTIERLNTSTYIDWTTVASNTTELVGMSASVGLELDHGRHLLVVERVGPLNEQVQYSLSWGWATIESEDDEAEGEWVDHSGKFQLFYIIVGVLFLLPWVFVFYWQWQDRGALKLEGHERRRLGRLRERLLAADIEDADDPHALIDALQSLEDTDWEALISEWGSPAVRHLTEGIDLACWRLESATETTRLAVGLSIGAEEWTLAALRFQAVEGAEWSINAVVPEVLVDADELFLGELGANSSRFLRVDLSGAAGGFDIHLSGLVGGEPIAAVPLQAVMLEEE